LVTVYRSVLPESKSGFRFRDGRAADGLTANGLFFFLYVFLVDGELDLPFDDLLEGRLDQVPGSSTRGGAPRISSTTRFCRRAVNLKLPPASSAA
jgi:hypothetical protein